MKPGKIAACLITGLLVVTAAGVRSDPAPAAPKPQPLSLEEARRTVRLMNDIYVTGVLTAHKMYAHEPGSAAAIAWGKQVIKEVNGKGWPKARVFAFTDKMLNPENQVADDFEKQAAAAFGKGQPTFEQVTPGSYRYATPIRLAAESCLTCHVRNKLGDLVGGVSYEAVLAKR